MRLNPFALYSKGNNIENDDIELNESFELTEDTTYQDLYTDLSVKTENWTTPSGEVRYSDKTEADVALSILQDRYENVKLEPLDFKDGNDLSYHIVFSDNMEEDFDNDGLNWFEDKNPEGSPIGEALDDEEYITCPICGEQAEYIEDQGNFKFYHCLGCGEYLFKNKKGIIRRADDAFDENGNLLTEAKGSDSFDDAQIYYDSIKKPEQEKEVEKLNNHFLEMGFEMADFEQTIPSKNANMYFKIIKFNGGDQVDEYKEEVESELKDLGAQNINFSQAIDYNGKAYMHGSFYLDGMTLKEKVEEAIENHDELNQKIFNENDELDPEVKDKLLEIVDKFKEKLSTDDIKLDIKDVVIVGSNVGYNYTKDSDIDLHIIADLSAYPNQEELAEKVYNAYKSLFNDKYDPTIHGIPVEIYVEPYQEVENKPDENFHESLDEAVSKGVYSLYNGWIQKPEKENIKDLPDIKAKYSEYESKAKSCDTIEAIDSFLDDIYKLRQSSLLSDGEYGEGNLIFKELRNNNILKDLKDKKVELENNEMSLKESLFSRRHKGMKVNKAIINESVIEEATEEDIKAKALADYLDISVEAVDDEGDNYYDCPEGEYVVYTEEEADQAAKESLMSVVEDIGLDAFSKNFQEDILNNYIDESKVDEYIEEELDYFRDNEEDQDMVEYLENLEGAAAVDYIKENCGEDFNKFAMETGLIDFDAVIDECIRLDGRGNTLATYDGDELELENNLYAYRVN